MAAALALTVSVGLTGFGAPAQAAPGRFPCPPNTPRGMDCDNPQPLPPPFAPAAPPPHANSANGGG